MIPGIVMILRLIPIPQGLKYDAQEHENAHVIDLLKSQSLRKAFITSGIILTGSSIFNFYFPIYGKHLGFTSSEIGLVLSANALAFFVIRMLMPVLLKKFKEEKILFNSLIITALCFLAVPLFKNVILLLCLAFLMGLGLGCGQPLSIVMAYNRSPTGRTGEVLGVRLTVNKIVLFTVPVIFGSLGTVLGFIPIFWSNAILLFLGGYFTFEKPKEKKD